MKLYLLGLEFMPVTNGDYYRKCLFVSVFLFIKETLTTSTMWSCGHVGGIMLASMIFKSALVLAT